MFDLLKLIFLIYLITLIFSMIVSVIKFWIDTSKFSRKKKTFEEEISDEATAAESEVNSDAGSNEHNTSTFFNFGNQS